MKDLIIIFQTIFADIRDNQFKYGLESPEILYKKLAIAGRYDTADVIFIERILQKGLPEELRARMIDRLFRELVTKDEASFVGSYT